jgi:beta-lactamase class A
VVIPSEGVTFEFQGGMTFPLLSVVKLPIMLTFLDKAMREGRAPTPYEARLLDQMIRASDNNAASSLWNSSGRVAGMNSFLQTIGFQPLDSDEHSWGETLASPAYMATLMSKLFLGEALDEPNRATAMTLLETVADSQNWGAAAGAAPGRVGVKNGWYREKDGAMIHSVAYVIPDQGPPYAIAVFTRGNASPLVGINLIEEFATHVNAAMAARR